MYDLKKIVNQLDHPVLVQSIDGVGTKMMVAKKMKYFDTIGYDLVSATTNDIIVLGAKPLTLLDYIANDKLDPATIETIVTSIAEACRENDIVLIGGETAEMPGTYISGEHDLVGVVTGIVEKDKAITGANIQADDIVLGFASSGLHTNGYSLARKLFFDVGGYSVFSKLPGLKNTLGQELLAPHINYTKPVLNLLEHHVEIKGMAHITGGGLLENIPRILPAHCDVEINKNAWPQLPIFHIMQQLGRLSELEMYRTFNMGIGLVMIVAKENLAMFKQLVQALPQFDLYEIGRVIPGNCQVRLQ